MRHLPCPLAEGKNRSKERKTENGGMVSRCRQFGEGRSLPALKEERSAFRSSARSKARARDFFSLLLSFFFLSFSLSFFFSPLAEARDFPEEVLKGDLRDSARANCCWSWQRIVYAGHDSPHRGEERGRGEERVRAVYSRELYIAGSRHIILDPRRRLYIPLFPSSLFLPALAPERDCQVAGALPLFSRYFWLSLFDGWGPSDVATDSITTSVILRIRRIRFMSGIGSDGCKCGVNKIV